MTLTAMSNLYGAIHEDAINRVVRWMGRYRPTVFNYGTAWVAQQPFERLCHKPEVIDDILTRGRPVISVEPPLPVPGTGGAYGLNWCLQLTELEIDFEPTSVFALPAELGNKLAAQQFALHAQACFGLGCPPKWVLREFPPPDDRRQKDRPADAPQDQRPDSKVLPTDEMTCVCLDLFVTGHVVTDHNSGAWHVTFELDGLEIVDVGPDRLESLLECYAETVVRYAVLPRLALSFNALTVGIPLNLGAVTVAPATSPPHNPAVEDDQLKVFIDLGVTP